MSEDLLREVVVQQNSAKKNCCPCSLISTGVSSSGDCIMTNSLLCVLVLVSDSKFFVLVLRVGLAFQPQILLKIRKDIFLRRRVKRNNMCAVNWSKIIKSFNLRSRAEVMHFRNRSFPLVVAAFSALSVLTLRLTFFLATRHCGICGKGVQAHRNRQLTQARP